MARQFQGRTFPSAGGTGGTMVRVSGLRQLSAALKDLDDKVRRNYIRTATRRAGKIIKDEAVANAPEDTGTLKKAIVNRLDKAEETRYSVRYVVGVIEKDAYYAWMVEKGTQSVGRVTIGERNARGRRVGGADPPDVFYEPTTYGFFTSFMHGRRPATPYMRPAWHENKHKAQDEMGRYLAKKMRTKR